MPEPDFVYENAPLVEVIAEVRWQLKPLRVFQDAAIDPFFDLLAEGFQEKIGKFGIHSVQKMIHEIIPLELTPGKIVYRYRAETNSWPVFQLGPGVFTVNITPPYDGFAVFRDNIVKGLDCFLEAYPSPEKFLTINSVELRYLDAFSFDHGFECYPEFLKDHLGINLTVKEDLLSKYLAPKSPVHYNIQTQIPLTRPEGSIGIIKAAPGKKENRDAAIFESAVRKQNSTIDPNTESLIAWFDMAHSILHDWFQIMTSSQLKARMGPSRKIGGS